MAAGVIVPFVYALRSKKVPVGTQEILTLARALGAELHDSSVDGFYHVARATLIHDEKHLDLFDEVFLLFFKGIEVEGKKLRDELLEWLKEAIERQAELTPEELEIAKNMDLDELMKLFEERLREQDERHDGGKKWIGTGGASPFGHSGAPRPGIRVGGSGGNRSAVKVADARVYRPYRNDLALDVRQMQVALRKLRMFARDGADDELDLDGTIDATAKNAGELEVVVRPPRRPSTRVILMMDVGGSMDPYAHLVSRLFTAASKATHFKELRTYYFHNCVYGYLYKTEKLDEPVRVNDLLREVGKTYKLIMVGDALMAPYELLHAGGSLDLGEDNRLEGIGWLMKLAAHFDRTCWLNPEPPQYWYGNTIEYVKNVFPMYPLTLDGLGEAVTHLLRGTRRVAA